MRQADGSAMPNSATHTTTRLDMSIGSHLEHATYWKISQFAGEDLVIPDEWLKTHQPHIPWEENKVTFNSKYCQ